MPYLLYELMLAETSLNGLGPTNLTFLRSRGVMAYHFLTLLLNSACFILRVHYTCFSSRHSSGMKPHFRSIKGSSVVFRIRLLGLPWCVACPLGRKEGRGRPFHRVRVFKKLLKAYRAMRAAMVSRVCPRRRGSGDARCDEQVMSVNPLVAGNQEIAACRLPQELPSSGASSTNRNPRRRPPRSHYRGPNENLKASRPPVKDERVFCSSPFAVSWGFGVREYWEKGTLKPRPRARARASLSLR